MTLCSLLAMAAVRGTMSVPFRPELALLLVSQPDYNRLLQACDKLEPSRRSLNNTLNQMSQSKLILKGRGAQT